MSSKAGSKPVVRKTPVVEGVGRYATYIRRIFKNVVEDLKERKQVDIAVDMHISGQSLIVIDQMIHHTLEQIMQSANRLRLIAKAKTLSGKHIKAAVELLRRSAPKENDLQSAMIKAAESAYDKVKTHAKQKEKSSSKKKPEKVEVAAGITLSVSRVRREMKVFTEGCSCRFASSAGVYLAAMLDKLVRGILVFSIISAKHNKRKTVSTAHIKVAVRNNAELDNLFARFIFSLGVQSHVHIAVLTKKQGGLRPNPKRKSKKDAEKKPKRKSKKAAPKKSKK